MAISWVAFKSGVEVGRGFVATQFAIPWLGGAVPFGGRLACDCVVAQNPLTLPDGSANVDDAFIGDIGAQSYQLEPGAISERLPVAFVNQLFMKKLLAGAPGDFPHPITFADPNPGGCALPKITPIREGLLITTDLPQGPLGQWPVAALSNEYMISDGWFEVRFPVLAACEAGFIAFPDSAGRLFSCEPRSASFGSWLTLVTGEVPFSSFGLSVLPGDVNVIKEFTSTGVASLAPWSASHVARWRWVAGVDTMTLDGVSSVIGTPVSGFHNHLKLALRGPASWFILRAAAMLD